MKCLHGMYSKDGCAICKGWPDIQEMRVVFPTLTDGVFAVMRPEERLQAMKTRSIPGLDEAVSEDLKDPLFPGISLEPPDTEERNA